MSSRSFTNNIYLICIFLCINKIWYWITIEDWYAIKPNKQTKPFPLSSSLSYLFFSSFLYFLLPFSFYQFAILFVFFSLFLIIYLCFYFLLFLLIHSSFLPVYLLFFYLSSNIFTFFLFASCFLLLLLPRFIFMFSFSSRRKRRNKRRKDRFFLSFF